MVDSRLEEDIPECGDGLSWDRLFELLADERRRYVISQLREGTAPVSVADLARDFGEWKSGDSDSATPADQEAALHSLYHSHVPKLADSDVVDYARDRNTVEPAENFECAVSLWDSIRESGYADSSQ